MDFEALREQMVTEQIEARGITDARVLEAMRHVPRHAFVPDDLQHLAYRDGPLPIGNDQTISQPYIVALMTQLLALSGTETVLEIGTGSGYQTAILCELAQQVFSLERDRYLANEASKRLSAMGYTNVEVYVGDGSQGFPDMAPFDGIIVSAAAPAIPGPLRAQLAEGGRLVLPVGNRHNQTLQRVTRTAEGWQTDEIAPVMFVLLYGRYGFRSGRGQSSAEE
ncbi:MAG: protein-L-isoaspartate(D-aspartate) O-methyltransferase [Anaerolineae bacterium]|nr:protein-L-isoaspartate(D-aspartate) O-methyltransferase [Anaerolineae bacterium]